MDLNILPKEIQYIIMDYLQDNHIIYKRLNYKKIRRYINIYNHIHNKGNKAYIINSLPKFERKTRVDYQIHQYSNYLYLSNKELLADYNGESPAPTYLRKKNNTVNIFIYEVIKILLNKNILQRYYPGKIEEVIINIKNYKENYSLYEKIDNNSIIKLSSNNFI